MRQYKEDKIIVERILGLVADAHTRGLEADPVIMDHAQLQKPHQKAVTAGGRILGISLDKGEHLRPGAVLYLDDRVVIFVDLPEEDLLEIRPLGNLEWGKAAYNIGNMHQPAYLYEEMIRCPYDSVLERVLAQLGIPFERKTGKLDGLRANLQAAHSHAAPTHSHDGGAAHSHDHHHGE